MDLNVQDWKDFRVGDIFPKQRLKHFSAIPDVEGDVPFITSTSVNNGIAAYVDEEAIPGNCITVSTNGDGFDCFYQPSDIALSNDAEALYNNNLNQYNAIFLISVLALEKLKYGYGRKPKNGKVYDTLIKLPFDFEGNPDWQFMEDYIKSLHCKNLTTQNKVGNVPNLGMHSWGEFRFGDLISDIYKSKAINKDDLIIAQDDSSLIRYITRTGDNNGCELLADKSSVDVSYIEEGNALTIGDTTATCFYQSDEFITGDHMVVVRADTWLNQFTGLFIVAVLTNEQYKYSYGRAFLMDRIKDTLVKLPVDSEGNPDWRFMEDYIKALPYGDRLAG